MRPQSQFQERRMLPQSPLEGYDTGHCYRSVTAVTASRILPQSSLQECYSGHCFKQVTLVTASRSPLQECYRSHRFKNRNAVNASRRGALSRFQERCRCWCLYTFLFLRFTHTHCLGSLAGTILPAKPKNCPLQFLRVFKNGREKSCTHHYDLSCATTNMKG